MPSARGCHVTIRHLDSAVFASDDRRWRSSSRSLSPRKQHRAATATHKAATGAVTALNRRPTNLFPPTYRPTGLPGTGNTALAGQAQPLATTPRWEVGCTAPWGCPKTPYLIATQIHSQSITACARGAAWNLTMCMWLDVTISCGGAATRHLQKC